MRKCLSFPRPYPLARQPCLARTISTNSAIQRALRQLKNPSPTKPSALPASWSDTRDAQHNTPRQGGRQHGREQKASALAPGRGSRAERIEPQDFGVKKIQSQARARKHAAGSIRKPGFSHINSSADEPYDFPNDRIDTSLDAPPLSIPYTTAASEFLYGRAAVTAALLARRRKLYKLYVHPRAAKDGNYLLSVASELGVPVVATSNRWDSLLSRMSQGRPHNGLVLECSPLPRIPITSLGPVTPPASPKDLLNYQITVAHQSAEDEAINGRPASLPYSPYSTNSTPGLPNSRPAWRYPLVLLFESLLNEGNLGAAIRSALYLGVDAIVLGKRGVAPISAITLAAASGAAEALPILSMEESIGVFLAKSKENGWKVYAATSPPTLPPRLNGRESSEGSASDKSSHSIPSDLVSFSPARSGSRIQRPYSPLSTAPSILVFGDEGAGISAKARQMTDCFVSINPLGPVDGVGLDSLNLSVAVGMLCAEFMRAPQGNQAVREGNESMNQLEEKNLGKENRVL